MLCRVAWPRPQVLGALPLGSPASLSTGGEVRAVEVRFAVPASAEDFMAWLDSLPGTRLPRLDEIRWDDLGQLVEKLLVQRHEEGFDEQEGRWEEYWIEAEYNDVDGYVSVIGAGAVRCDVKVWNLGGGPPAPLLLQLLAEVARVYPETRDVLAPYLAGQEAPRSEEATASSSPQSDPVRQRDSGHFAYSEAGRREIVQAYWQAMERGEVDPDQAAWAWNKYRVTDRTLRRYVRDFPEYKPQSPPRNVS